MPRLSILTPTLNSARTLDTYFAAIRAQRFAQNEIEIIIADGGSSDDTVSIARAHGAKVVANALKTGEAGKAAALRAATGEFVAFIDSDNILVGDDWLSRMLAPFADERIVGSEPMSFSATRSDSLVDRYCALAGVNDPLCLFMGNYDKYSSFTGRWTGLRLNEVDCGDYVDFSLDQPLPTIGANGTVYRRSALEWFDGRYFMDIDVPYLLAQRFPQSRFAKVRTSIRHLFCATTQQFKMKQTRRIRDFFSKAHQPEEGRIYPWHLYTAKGVTQFSIATLTVVPLLMQALRAYKTSSDPAAFVHPLACWMTLYIYAINFLFGRGKSLSRENWQVGTV